ncbi:MAG: hypothetical protein V1747_03725 [Candidatus Omnitrophota bacterium]
MRKKLLNILVMTLIQALVVMNTAWAGGFCGPHYQVLRNNYLSPRTGINALSLQNIFGKGLASEMNVQNRYLFDYEKSPVELSPGTYQTLAGYCYELAARLAYPEQSNLGERLRAKWMEENQDIRNILPYFAKRSLNFFAEGKGVSLEKYITKHFNANDQFTEMVKQLKSPLVFTTTFFLRHGDYWVKPLVRYLERIISIKHREENYQIMVQSLGGSSGKEAYAIALIIHRCLENYAKKHGLGMEWVMKWDIDIEVWDQHLLQLSQLHSGRYSLDNDAAIFKRFRGYFPTKMYRVTNNTVIFPENIRNCIRGNFVVFNQVSFPTAENIHALLTGENNVADVTISLNILGHLDQYAEILKKGIEIGFKSRKYPSLWITNDKVDSIPHVLVIEPETQHQRKISEALKEKSISLTSTHAVPGKLSGRLADSSLENVGFSPHENTVPLAQFDFEKEQFHVDASVPWRKPNALLLWIKAYGAVLDKEIKGGSYLEDTLVIYPRGGALYRKMSQVKDIDINFYISDQVYAWLNQDKKPFPYVKIVNEFIALARASGLSIEEESYPEDAEIKPSVSGDHFNQIPVHVKTTDGRRILFDMHDVLLSSISPVEALAIKQGVVLTQMEFPYCYDPEGNYYGTEDAMEIFNRYIKEIKLKDLIEIKVQDYFYTLNNIRLSLEQVFSAMQRFDRDEFLSIYRKPFVRVMTLMRLLGKHEEIKAWEARLEETDKVLAERASIPAAAEGLISVYREMWKQFFDNGLGEENARRLITQRMRMTKQQRNGLGENKESGLSPFIDFLMEEQRWSDNVIIPDIKLHEVFEQAI